MGMGKSRVSNVERLSVAQGLDEGGLNVLKSDDSI